MNQAIAIQEVTERISKGIADKEYEDPKKALALLNEITQDLQYFFQEGIDYKIVVDSMDDSIYITDKDGRCLYVNPAHKTNTGIDPEEVLGRSIYDIVEEGKLFTGGATIDVLEQKKKVFRTARVMKTNPPSMGYTVGVPIFNKDGELHQVVVSSRPILSLQSLQEDFGKFMKDVNTARESQGNVAIIPGGEARPDGFAIIKSTLESMWNTIRVAAPTDATVLITGESGVGKEVVADEIYRLSGRSGMPFVKVNCASIPANLLESELFGYEKGAFSGANANGKRGLFEMANGGTILLDEIGEMSMDLQVKLLRAIQSKEITRVGGTKPIKLDVRFISATNCDLKTAIAEGKFRQDLYFRLKVIPINIPPLRERLGDMEELCDHFLAVFNQKYNRSLQLTEEQINLMKKYSWPGNIRELENIIEYLSICSSGNVVSDEMLEGLLDITQGEEQIPEPAVEEVTLNESVENYEKKILEKVLSESKNLREAGAKLGVNASTISRKIKLYGIDYHK